MLNVQLSDEQRKFTRIIYRNPAILSDKTESWAVEILDLSLKGCMLTVAEDWSGILGRDYLLDFHLGGSINITMELILARHDGQFAGFQCIHIDLDSICELRRLVELNLGDSQILERDLVALANNDH